MPSGPVVLVWFCSCWRVLCFGELGLAGSTSMA